jgi:hypothetical protein
MRIAFILAARRSSHAAPSRMSSAFGPYLIGAFGPVPHRRLHRRARRASRPTANPVATEARLATAAVHTNATDLPTAVGTCGRAGRGG